ncbi:MAG: hypothetical protein U1D41_14925, partial [Nitrosomonas sp.]|uniref:hypothetical protein n=1 Tax=Nitrosomonas sp. TaxID=42353 RepID=UPI0027349908
MRKKYFIFIVGMISGILIGVMGAHANTIGPKPFVATALAKGTLFASPTGSGTTCSLASPCSIWTVISKAKSGSVVFL